MNKPLEKAEKNEVIENMLEGLSKMLGTPRSVAFESSTCVTCSGEAKDFRDATSENSMTTFSFSRACLGTGLS